MRFDENRVIELHSVEKDKTVSPPSDRPPKGGSTECNSSAEKALTQPSPKGEGVSAMHSNRGVILSRSFFTFFLMFFIIAHISINIQQKCTIYFYIHSIGLCPSHSALPIRGLKPLNPHTLAAQAESPIY